MVMPIEFDLDHLSIIVGLIVAFTGLILFMYKLLTWIYKVNYTMNTDHKYIVRMNKKIQGLLGNEGFDEEI